MTNNIIDNNSTKVNKTTPTAATTATAASTLSVLVHVPDDTPNNDNITRSNDEIPTYAHGIWYHQHTDDSYDNPAIISLNLQRQQQYQMSLRQQIYDNPNDNIVRLQQNTLWLANGNEQQKQQQQQTQSQQHKSSDNNNISQNHNCDIIIVDIEEESYSRQQLQQQQEQLRISTISSLQQQHLSDSQKFIINANMKYQQLPMRRDTEICLSKLKTNNNNDNHDNINNVDDINDKHNNVDDDDNDNVDDDDDSLASMETLSDNVSIWIDGEKHWVAGVDENTTCSDLIWALLYYQNGQKPGQQQQQYKQQIYEINVNKTNNHQQQQQQQHLQQQQQQKPKEHHKNYLDNNSRKWPNNKDGIILYTDHKPNTNFSSCSPANLLTSNNNTHFITNTSLTTTTNTINQSMPINTKENYKITQNSSTTATTTATTAAAVSAVAATKSTVSSSSTPVSSTSAVLTTLPSVAITLPSGITTASQLATEYVIVKQYHHCEEYLDGTTKVFDVLPPRDGPQKKECELLLRHLGPAPTTATAAVYGSNSNSNSNNNNNLAATPQLSSLISTDKDSGMGSPVGSARSAKFRRRKHKSSQWLAQANTLHPKLSHCTANERLMKIILAQDETIQRQLSMLREKERQITKIEEEKHRKRERELGKNYLLETYLNGLDEAECEPEIQDDGEEIFIDEPYQQCSMTTAVTEFPELRTSTTTTQTDGAATTSGGIQEAKQSEALNMMMMMAKNKFKEMKKDKKIRRHKDKITKKDYIQTTSAISQTKDLNNSKTNKNKDKDRDKDKEKPDGQNQFQENENITLATTALNDSNETEIEMQILWLEKIYTLNKQLQKEEEMSAKLHAKVRKHQLRKAQHTQKEVQMEIDKLDNNLALQCGDIRKIEANLMETNEQLQKKLQILERLSLEYLEEEHQQQQPKQVATSHNVNEQFDNEQPNILENLRDIHNTKIMENLEKPLDKQKLSLNNIKSAEEVKELQKILAKPSLELKEIQKSLNQLNEIPFNVVSKPQSNLSINPCPEQQPGLSGEFSNENLINSLNTSTALISSSRHIFNNTQENNYYHHPQPHLSQEIVTTPLPTSSTALTMSTTSTTTIVTGNTSTLSSAPSPSSYMFIDKNMLSSLQVQNAKTIKKQMFHTQTSPAISTAAAAAATTMTGTSVIAATTIAFPKQQFQHFTQHMPRASTILTSRPQISHQIPKTGIVILKHPSAILSSSTPLDVAATIPAIPASSTSPTPSLMAMNTVDISQLGTLV